ncbi:polysaccharide biosynthesis tyrosine autokinase [Aeoliella sp. ICT_H6.2]|uniref:Polysaccharide biosynthesis tyrosine autokinase n=1 Tax=Aeoliella straminimaris TaxID=2954799 RepID=A0A9X2JEY0_9BACT|nr:polysaccharide biosynthesis tyrosine autokinase [Aeoliella straminimaris]MCO6043136.1 polysaccharide biosynthesis tyrosine autokinase [Aeoliella straminimaris]
MANHDHSHPTASGENQPLVPASHPSHDPHGGALEVAHPFASPTFSRTPAVVNGSMDASWFFNSLRRRWLLATCMGLLVATGVGFALFYLFPESDTALARFLVSSEKPSVVYSDLDTGDSHDYEIYKATQKQMVRSSKVLNVALDNPEMQKVSFLRKEENPTIWLYDNLDVRFEGNSELMRVSLTLDEDPEEMEIIIKSICDAYMDEVVRASRFERVELRDSLKSTYRKLMDDIRQKREEYLRLSEELGIAEGQFDPSVRMLFDELSNKMKQKSLLEEQILATQLEYDRWIAYKKNPGLQEQQIDAMVAANENVAYQEQEILMLQAQLRDAEKRSSGRTTREMRRIQKDLNYARQNLQTEKSQLRQQIKQQIANQPDHEIALVTEEMQRKVGYLAGRMRQLMNGRDITQEDGSTERELGIDELKEALEAKAAGSTELTIRRAELDQLDDVARDLSQRIQAWDIELDPASIEDRERVRVVESAYTMPGINKYQRYAITGLGSVATLLLTCLGIAYLEFMGRRLNGPEQVDEGLGIRVVGTLPALNAKRMMNPKHPLVAQLTESIDSVRTALMHDSNTKRRQVVLVTSPSAMEGRTTVASQLAASLARAGRRTLLIDGDLRRPALHSLFDVPLEDGLCEVLRAEADVADVVRPTHAEGLWLMTAGYCDADAVHAMATDQIQPIFDKLRADYDFVIIDGAPVLGLSDSLMMGQHCDGALLSVLRDYTSVPSIYKSSELLRDVGVRLIGAVVNGVSARADRRVTHLQIASPKAARKQLEDQHSDVAVATKPATEVDDLDDLDFSDLSNDD